MVTNLMTVESIGFDQFVVRERSRWDRRHRRQSRDGKRRASREASEFQISCRGCRQFWFFSKTLATALSRIAISALIIATIWLGVYPQPILNALKR